MKPIRVYRNRDVESIYAFIPPGHKHIRLVIETSDQVIVLQEAAVAGIVRAYLNVLLHPARRAIALKSKRIKGKPGYAEHQLVEQAEDGEAFKEIKKLGLEGSSSQPTR